MDEEVRRMESRCRWARGQIDWGMVNSHLLVRGNIYVPNYWGDIVEWNLETFEVKTWRRKT